MGLSYGADTYKDSLFIKRWLHCRRFAHALKLLDLKAGEKILDYGCGDGYFLKLIKNHFPAVEAAGFEPYAPKCREAQKELSGLDIDVFQSIESIRGQKFDKITCLETAEHLADKELEILGLNVRSLLVRGGLFIITVPIEIGVPALIKNTYRLLKNRHYDNLNITNYFKAIAGFGIKRRIITLEPGLEYIFSHTGFDHRVFEKQLAKYFFIERKEGQPWAFFGAIFNNNLYYFCRLNYKA
ncbi:MAG: methyltransferase domain-containing protein [Patescibacteria group bacterium]